MFTSLRLALFLSCAVAATAATDVDAFEAKLEQLTNAETVTVVHFWASWCSNCRAEHADEGWRRFVEKHPEVKVVFVSLWGSAEDDRKLLEGYGLTEQANFLAHRHPNQGRRRDDRVQTVLGQPVNWVPTTWIYRKGLLRYALNYGEVRFEILDQLVEDAQRSW